MKERVNIYYIILTASAKMYRGGKYLFIYLILLFCKIMSPTEQPRVGAYEILILYIINILTHNSDLNLIQIYITNVKG